MGLNKQIANKNKNTLTRRRWRAFKNNRRGYYSLIIFTIIFVVSMFAEVISNDKPLLVKFEGNFYFPLLYSYPETTFGGDFKTATDYRDPYILNRLQTGGNRVWFPLN